jgi:hypothetical protein
MTLSMTAREPGSVYSRLRAVGIPHDVIQPILLDVENWSKKSGEEWTVSRLKSFKNDIIRIRAGMEPVSVWISRKGSNFSGSFGVLQRWMMRSSSSFSKGIQAIQIYSTYYAPRVTPKQHRKFIDAVLTPPVQLDVQQVMMVISRGIIHSDLGRLSSELPLPKPILLMQGSPDKRAPLPDGTSVSEDCGIVDSLTFLDGSNVARDHYYRYKKLYRPVIGTLKSYTLIGESGNYFSRSLDPDALKVGRIGLIQEAGYKLRAVANPGRVFQRVLEPLGNCLYGILKRLPWDCTFNQSLGWEPIQAALSKGVVVTCFDLSNATDLFPLSIQIEIMRELLGEQNNEHIDLFREISRGLWFYPGIGWIQWKVGQPLGLYPSFAAFALSHGIILLGLLNKPYSGEFYILGDDVVILDASLASRYQQFMESIGCKIAMDKSIRSKTIAEFGGKLITPTSIITQMKHRNISDDSFVDLARQLGPKSLPIFKPKQREVLKRISPLPEFLGGLGWNPEGLPLEKRLSLAFRDRQPRPLLTDYTSHQIRNLLRSKIYEKWVRLNESETTYHFIEKTFLEQRSLAYVSYMGRHLVPLTRIMGRNIDLVFEDSHLNVQVLPDRLRNQHTLLERMRDWLGL